MRLITATALTAAALSLVGATQGGAVPNPQNTCPGGAKVEPVADGTYYRSLGGTSIRITLNVNEAAKTFSFTTNRPVTSVLVKGGTGALTYSYPSGATAGSGLHAPVNLNNGGYYGLSHVCFFSSKKGKK
jgi:hypothetical protein